MENDLNTVLRNQRYVNDNSGLEFSKIKNYIQIKMIIFVKSINTYNNVQFKKLCHNVHHRKT